MPPVPRFSLRPSLAAFSLFSLVLLRPSGAVAQTPFTCIVNAPIPPMLRAEGLTDRAGDLILQCTGGSPIASGSPVPTNNITIFYNTTVTNRLLAGAWSEPLLIVNEPQPASQLACNSVTGICPVTGTGGTSTYNGTAGHPNIFQGQVSANAVTFLSVPIDPPGATGSLILRVTDVRVNASGVPPAGGLPGQVSALVSAAGLSVTNPQQIVGFVGNSLNTQVRTSDDAAVLAAGGFSFDQCGSADKNRFATLRFSEAFATAFRTRTSAAFVDPNTSPSPVPQNVPGMIYNAETGFYNPSLTGANGNLAVAGLADYGTRVRAVFHNIPAGVSLWVATEAVAFSGGNPVLKTSGLRARLITSETGPFNATPATATPDGIPAAQLTVTAGTATAVWEVLAADPFTNENLDLPVWLSYTASGAGTGTLNLSYAPAPPAFTLADGTNASASLPLARFLDSSTTSNLFVINACISVSPPSLSNATEAQPYSVQLSASGGAPGYSWSVVSGAPPPGVNLAANGQLSGTPLSNGAYQFTVRVTDAAGRSLDTTYSLTVQMQAGCTYNLNPLFFNGPAAIFNSGVNVTPSASNCAWAGFSNAAWLTITGGQVSTGNGMLSFSAAANLGAGARTGTLSIAGQTFTVTQAGTSSTSLSVLPGSLAFMYRTGDPAPSSQMLMISSGAVVLVYSVQYNANWLAAGPTTGWTPAPVFVSVNPAGLAPGTYSTNVTINAAGANGPVSVPVTLVVYSSLQFYPIPPCRVADTRSFTGPPGPLGPPSITAHGTRSFPVLSSPCGVPANAVAYSLNVSAVPLTSYLGYVTVWGSGNQPPASTLNSWDGRIVANAALIPAGIGGAVSIYASDATDVFFDINGYFAPPNAGGLQFYPMAPCRVADTRSFTGPPGPLGPPSMIAHSTRSFPVLASPCGIPASAVAYSLNVAAVPSTSYLGYLTTWGTGQPQPVASTLNSWTGTIVANAAIVPAGTAGAISIYVSDATDVFFDINGYFAPPGAGGLQYHTLPPCRIADTRSFTGPPGPLGPPSMTAHSSRSFPVLSSLCGVPATAAAYALYVTAVPNTSYLGYLTTWATGQPQPVASTLNSWTGTIVPNAALVPAGTGGDISIYVSDATDVFFDIFGYFAP